ncbi:MAG: hypothetical protein HY698_18110 [Deltaproteobacteria bacterium]|nr:hypothetical protein [Deltaproteobacteria bacterium]
MPTRAQLGASYLSPVLAGRSRGAHVEGTGRKEYPMNLLGRASLSWLVVSLAASVSTGCGGSSITNIDSVDGGKPATVDGGTSDPDGSTTPDGSKAGVDGGGASAADAGIPWHFNDAGQPLCSDKTTGGMVVCQCADGKDNEASPDGKIDALDPECAGPYDHDESTFSTGIPGDNSDPWVQDCFFDGDSGGGNDGCRWDIRCKDYTPPYEGEHCKNNLTNGCDYCRSLTPNGCDCFGCCDIWVDGTAYRVRIVDTCTADKIQDTTACPRCQFVDSCSNPCDPCVETCIGETPDPSTNPDCQSRPDGGTISKCPEGVQECSAEGNCPGGYSCVTGCCQRIIID